MAKGTKVKGVKVVGDLKYVFISGEGRNNAMPGETPHFQYVASLSVPENGTAHKAYKAFIDAEWKEYKETYGVKGLPKTNGIKPEMKDDPKGTIDPATEKVQKVPTGNVLITFKTNTKWPDGNPQVVKVFDGKGNDITSAVHNADWAIGDGSTGVIHGTAMGNNTGGTHKVTLYLTAVQVAKLVKYEGDTVETEDIGEELDLGDAQSAIPEIDVGEDEIPF